MPVHLPALEQLSDVQYFACGEVWVESSAGIAPGVLLQANPGSRIEVGAGVCIGMGSVLHAYGDGILRVEPGATIGTGVLLVGCGTIGRKACIGSAATVINPAIPPDRIVAPGSLVGDPRQPPSSLPDPDDLTDSEKRDEQLTEESAQAPDPAASPAQNQNGYSGSSPNSSPSAKPMIGSSEPAGSDPEARSIPGQSQISDLLLKIYPHRRPLRSDHSNL